MTLAPPLHSLPIFVRLAGRAVILLGDGDAADAKRRLLERAGAVIVGEDGNAALAIVAIAHEQEAQDAITRLKARRILVNAVDRPDACDFTLPAIVDRSPVLIAIGTGGVSAGLAAALRQRLEAMLPASLGGLATALSQARSALRKRYPEIDRRRRALGAALAAGGALDPMRADASAVAGWLASDASPDDGVITMSVPADPDDLTLRQARLLGQADRLFHRSDVPAAILDRARADAVRIECTAVPSDPGSGVSIDLSLRP